MEAAQNRLDPPPLAAAVNDKTGKKKTDEHRAPESDQVLVALGRHDKSQEEHEDENDDRRIVGRIDHKPDEQKMDGNNPPWHAGPAIPGHPAQSQQLPTENQEDNRVGHDNAERGLPSEMREHKRRFHPHFAATITTGGAAK